MVDDLENSQSLVEQLTEENQSHQDGELRAKEDDGRSRGPDETTVLLKKPESKT